ncbi:NPCBM/NEW2 domain-containing protein [Clostridium tarantellae]|uniref:Alpha-galactosidase n=1 Tax=Clostridium tarantellae TaxID=39493 RepID=A0A6I1MJ60_9CLOT|nr:NPCBM/NEW2 domain-containing protein [Clostridium tarantellae]MPQ42964.1 hypothetical protein [Clostridium tarantellae]
MIETISNSYETLINELDNHTSNNFKETYNKVALTPPMGWSSWNSLKTNINESNVLEVASIFSKANLIKLGYEYLILEDGWQSYERNTDGTLKYDATKFPNGIKNLNNLVNSLGLKLGLYSSNSYTTCLGYTGSLNKENLDAETFANWGIEYLKYDNCNNVIFSSTAPEIDKIALLYENTKNYIYPSIEAENGQLIKNAKIITDSTSSNGKYVTGLSSNNGYILFSNIQIMSDGNYDLIIYYKNSGHLEISVNYGDIYYINTPSNSTTVKLSIYLKKGKNTIMFYNSLVLNEDSTPTQFRKMGTALKKATSKIANTNNSIEKSIVFSISDWGINKPWEWAKYHSNSWTTTFPTDADWEKIIYTYTTNMNYSLYSAPGSWNDAGTLQVGNGKLTYEENKSHFTLWCMMASPLIIGTNLKNFLNNDGTINFSNDILTILSNKDMISINQDKKGLQCRYYENNKDLDILIKPLENNTLAICILNKTSSAKNIKVSLKEILKLQYVNLPTLETYEIFDLWDKNISITNDFINATVNSHGVKAFKISEPNLKLLSNNENLTLNIESVLEANKTFLVNATFKNIGIEDIKNLTLSLVTPKSFSISPISTNASILKSDECYTAGWTLVTPNTEWDYILNVNANFTYSSTLNSQTISTSKHLKVLNPPKPNTSLSDMSWLSFYSVLGSITRNKSYSGKTLSINGISYNSGISVPANSEIKFFNGKNSINFYALIGIDDFSIATDPKSGFPCAIFQVFGDNEKIYDSGIIKYNETKEIYLDLSFYDIITLRVIDEANLYSFCHYNWINPTFKANKGC